MNFSKRKKIIILGDSLAMQRTIEGIAYEQTYGYLLKKYFESYYSNYFVIIMAKRANDTMRQSMSDSILYDIKQFKPDIVIIHLGIVDCAPRIFSKIERGIISLLPEYLSYRIINFYSKRRLFFTKYLPKKYVNIKNYEKNMQKILNIIIENKAIPIIINISNPPEKIAYRSYNFLNNVRKYNNILLNLSKNYNCKLINFNKIVEKNPNYLLSDGIHISKKGNQKLANEIIDCVNEIVKN